MQPPSLGPLSGRRVIAATGFVFGLAAHAELHAQTPAVPVGFAAQDQWNPVVCDDGVGGALLAWLDRRSGSRTDVYAQHLDATGQLDAGWPAGGLAVCDAGGAQAAPQITADGTGGAWIAWEDHRGSDADVRIQHLTGLGVPAPGWPVNGLAVSAAPRGQTEPVIATDGSGGVFAAWSDYRSGIAKTYLQHLTPDGADTQWPAGGALVCNTIGTQRAPALAADGAHGVVVVWEDGRNGGVDLFAQHVASNGGRGWDPRGRPVCTAPGDQRRPRAAPDGTGSAFIVWHDLRGTNYDVYGLRIAVSGDLDFPWLEDGLPIAAEAGAQFEPEIESDGQNGAYITWFDSRHGAGFDVYATRIDAAATTRSGWTAGGTLLSGEAGDQIRPRVAVDGAGGAWFAWIDRRTPPATLFVQHIDALGRRAACWPAPGVVMTPTAYDVGPPALAAVANGVVVAWTDLRAVTSSDVYACRIADAPPIQWPTSSVELTSAPGEQVLPDATSGATAAVPDDACGAFVAWNDSRDALTGPDLYLQHIGADGGLDARWPADGVALCSAAGVQEALRMVPDGQGGVFATWHDTRAGAGACQVFVQHLDAAGALANGFVANGRPVTATGSKQYHPSLAADGAGGVYVAWQERRGADFDVYLQHYDALGRIGPGWPFDGLAVSAAPGDQTGVVLCAVGLDVVAVWNDNRSGSSMLYGRGVTRTGSTRANWSSDGTALSNEPGEHQDLVALGDGAGGVLIAWRDTRAVRGQVFARHVAASGDAIAGWPVAGTVVLGATDVPVRDLRVAADGSGGAVFAWTARGRTSWSIVATQFGADGRRGAAWPERGQTVSSPPFAFAPVLVSVPQGTVVAWADTRRGSIGIFAQLFDAQGHAAGPPGGFAVGQAPGAQNHPALAADASGCVIAAWDERRPGGSDVFAQRVDLQAGLASAPIAAVTAALAATEPPAALRVRAFVTPGDDSPRLAISAAMPGPVRVDFFDVRGRRIRGWAATAATLEASRYTLVWDGRDDAGRRAAPGMYFVRIQDARATATAKVWLRR